MIQKRMFISKSMQRLLDLFKQIEDENIKMIIAEAVMLESKNRSSSRKNFPMQDLRNIIDANARLYENEHLKGN